MQALRIISDEHKNFWRIAVSLEQVATEIDRGGRVDPAFFDSVFDYIEQFADEVHHRKEDDQLFRLMRLRSDKAQPLIETLEEDHRLAKAQLIELKRKFSMAHSNDYSTLTQPLRDYAAHLKDHITKEETQAMPLSRQILTEQDWQEIDTKFLDNNDPVFGEVVNAKFRELHHRVVTLAPEPVGLGGKSGGTLDQPKSPGANDVLLEISRLESSYGRIKALKGLDLVVRRGETVALIGANGAGKTTFLRTLSGVQSMDKGEIWFDGENISNVRSDQRMRRGICHCPEGRQVFGPLSIEDNLVLGAYTRPKIHLSQDLERIYTMFPVLKEKRRLPAGTLSGGQQQMLAIGRALMGRPKLLLLDEPSMGLAPLLVEEVFNVIKALKSEGMTIILAEQNAFAALALSDRGYVLETGEITLTGTGEDLSSNEKVRAAYLGM